MKNVGRCRWHRRICVWRVDTRYSTRRRFIMHLEMEDKLEDQRDDGPPVVPLSLVTRRNVLVFRVV